MVKQFKGFRFDPDLYGEFKELAQNNDLMVTEAFEKFMKTCVEGKALVFSVAAPKSAMRLKRGCSLRGCEKTNTGTH